MNFFLPFLQSKVNVLQCIVWMEERAEMNQRGITVIVSLDSMENVVKVDWINKPVRTYLQYLFAV